MTDRFDLEQQILDCWKINDDVRLLAASAASTNDFMSLATVYEYKFNQLWATFENLVNTKQFNEPEQE